MLAAWKTSERATAWWSYAPAAIRKLLPKSMPRRHACSPMTAPWTSRGACAVGSVTSPSQRDEDYRPDWATKSSRWPNVRGGYQHRGWNDPPERRAMKVGVHVCGFNPGRGLSDVLSSLDRDHPATDAAVKSGLSPARMRASVWLVACFLDVVRHRRSAYHCPLNGCSGQRVELCFGHRLSETPPISARWRASWYWAAIPSGCWGRLLRAMSCS
jgi:hypothetical protein